MVVYLVNMLTTGSVSVELPLVGTHAAPFVIIEEFLPREEHAALVPLVLDQHDQFDTSLVGEGEYRPEQRESLTLPGPRPEKRQFRRRINAVLSNVIQCLGHSSFDIDFVEVKIRAYRDGDFFEVHQDCSELNRREISYVYFFHREPRRYTGGDLLLMDTDVEQNTYTEAGFTRIVPQNNAVVFFPSRYYHAAVPVSCPSRDFGDSRFVINGHIQGK